MQKGTSKKTEKMRDENPCKREWVDFHGYKVFRNGKILRKDGKELKLGKRGRNGGGFDYTAVLFYENKRHKWTISRLVAACFIGPIHGYQINHRDGNPENNNVENLERVTQSENVKHRYLLRGK